LRQFIHCRQFGIFHWTKGKSDSKYHCVSNSSCRSFAYKGKSSMTRWTRRSLIIGGALVAMSVIAFRGNKFRFSGLLPESFDEADLALLKAHYPNAAAARALGMQYLQVGGGNRSASLRRLQKQKS